MYKKIGVVIGTRPEAIKLIPVYEALQQRFGIVELLSTGQHQEMLEQILSFFEINPTVRLDVFHSNQSLAGLTSRLCIAIQNCIDEREYDLLVVQGDTATAMTAALIGFYNRIPVAHVEAGLRTYNKYSPFPEEVNRQIISLTADFHFAPTQKAFDVLMDQGIKNVHLVGNTVIDSLRLCLVKINQDIAKYQARFSRLCAFDRLVLITGHRRENFGVGFDGICNAVRQLSRIYPNFLFYYPVHLNPNVKIKVAAELNGLENVILDDPLPYDEIVYLMSRAVIILTDSGGIQEEAPTMNVPILVMRETTERTEGIESGCAVLVGTNPSKIIAEFTSIINDSNRYNQMALAHNPYGQGDSAARIAQILLDSSLDQVAYD